MLFFYDRKYFREKKGHKSHHHEEDNLPSAIEKYRSDTKKSCEKVDDISNTRLWKSELKESIVEVMGLISLHRVLSCENTRTDHIDEVNEIDAEDRHRSCDFSSSDDREGRDKKCQDDRPRVAHNPRAFDIHAGHEVGNRYKDREEDEDELAVFSWCDRSIGRIELDGEESDDEETNEGKSTREPRNPIGKIDTIEHEDVPKCCHQDGDIVDRDRLMKEGKVEKIIIQKGDPSEDIRHIADLDTRNPYDNPDEYLHREPCHRRDWDPTLPDRIHIIEEAHQRDDASEDQDDMESMLECRRDIECVGESDRHEEERHHDGDPDAIGDRLSPSLSLVEVRTIQDRIVFPDFLNSP